MSEDAKQRCYTHTFVTIDKCGCPPDPSLRPADPLLCGERVWHADGSYHVCDRRAKFLFARPDGTEERPLCGIHERALRRWTANGWLMRLIEGSDLGAEYGRRMFRPIELTPEDEDKVADLLQGRDGSS